MFQLYTYIQEVIHDIFNLYIEDNSLLEKNIQECI